jgi:hypothetical protein
MILMKLEEDYKLYSHDSCIATTHESPYKRLSKENCDEIFGVTDVNSEVETIVKTICPDDRGKDVIYGTGMAVGIQCFNKAMELNKDKLFTIKEVVELCKILLSNPIEKCGKTYQELTDDYIQSLQQPAEIEVEIEMVCPQCQDWGYVGECEKDCNKKFLQPKLDENSCLILKKK